MAAYLTENTSFSCVQCGAKFSAKEPGPGHASMGGSKILSTKAKLILKGPPLPSCPLIPGSPPPPCTYIDGIATLMPNSYDSSHMHGKSPLLTDNCAWNCGKGGIIKVSEIGVSKNRFLQGTVIVSDSGKGEKTDNSEAKENCIPSSAQTDNASQKEMGQPGAAEKSVNEDNKQQADQQEAKEELGKLQREDLHRALKCRKCSNADKCDKLKDICNNSFITDSVRLKKKL